MAERHGQYTRDYTELRPATFVFLVVHRHKCVISDHCRRLLILINIRGKKLQDSFTGLVPYDNVEANWFHNASVTSDVATRIC